MEISTDTIVYFQYGFLKINATLVYTWIVMAVMVIGSWLVTRRLSSGQNTSRWQNSLEAVVTFLTDQIEEITGQNADRYLPFIGTLGLFISLSNFFAFVPGYEPPTASLSTTSALAGCVFLATPIYGVADSGLFGYLKHYVEPSWFMLPFKLISELSRTLALAIRLFGNVMSGTIIAAILLLVIPLLIPVAMQALELLIGQVQAFIFAVLATVYIASGTRAHQQESIRAEDDNN